MVLSDFGLKDAESHGRSIFFWRGKPLPENAFRQKNRSKIGQRLRQGRNLLCLFALLNVCLVDPLLDMLFDQSRKEVKLCKHSCNAFVFLIVGVYALCLMYEEPSSMQRSVPEPSTSQTRTHTSSTSAGLSKSQIKQKLAAKVAELN